MQLRLSLYHGCNARITRLRRVVRRNRGIGIQGSKPWDDVYSRGAGSLEAPVSGP